MSQEIFEQRRGSLRISTDSKLIDVAAVHAFLRRSYWAADRTRAQLEQTIAASRCFGLYDDEHQIGFPRVVTDYAAFAWLCDVFIDETYRGRELGTWLLETVLADPHLLSVRRWVLATRDAHGLYEKFGFEPLRAPERWMERRDAL